MRNPFRRPKVTPARRREARRQLDDLARGIKDPKHPEWRLRAAVAALHKYGSWWSVDRARGLALLARAREMSDQRGTWFGPPLWWGDGRCVASCDDGPRCSRGATESTQRCALHHGQIVRYCCLVRRALHGRMAPALVDRVWHKLVWSRAVTSTRETGAGARASPTSAASPRRGRRSGPLQRRRRRRPPRPP